MKKDILWLLLLIIFSCKQPIHNHPIKSELKQRLDNIQKKVTDTPDINANMPSYNNDVYDKYIPKSVMALIDKHLPGWKLPPPNSWEKFWFQQYKKDTVLVNYIYADFNGDNKTDYAVILMNEKKDFAVWVLQSKDDVYEAVNLFKINNIVLPIDMGLELLPMGRLDYIDIDNDNPKPIYLKYPAIQIIAFEQSAETYYWKSGKYQSVTTGD